MPIRKIKAYLRRTKEQIFNGQKKDWKQYLALGAIIIAGLFVTGFLVFTILIAIVSIGLPDVRDLDKLSVAQSTTIYDREGNILYVKHGSENRVYIPFDQISTNVINATVAIEDDQFWQHSGFDAIGIVRALVNNTLHLGSQQGGSTITQQYIKNTFLSSERSYIRKLKELILAVQLEQTYDKKKILELYLNKIPYGNNAFGIEKGAEVYFNKKAKDLDLAESAILASLPKSQSYYNPYGAHRYSELTKEFSPEELGWRHVKKETDLSDNEFNRGLIGKTFTLADGTNLYVQGRTDIVLKTMEKLGYITEEQKLSALKELQNIKFNEYHENIKYPHFVFYVIDELEQKYGKELVEQGGLKVYTTIDPKLEDTAEKVISEGALSNEKKFNAKNGSLVAMDPKTGQILAMVGSRNYFDKEIDGAVNVADQYRQPGSSFKPFVYAQAFYNRYAPGSIVFDTETRLGTNAFPKDYDGIFRGPMSIRTALGQSRNIPAIKAYFLAGEQEPIKQLAERMGINFLDRNRDYGWPLALGAAEVKLTDMVTAFSVFANNGIKHKPVTILKVANANGDILEEWKADPGEEVLDPQIAYLINSILSDTSVRLGENITVPGHTNAAKTGTSNRKLKNNLYLPHDLWSMGYTPSLVAGVWTGNNRDDEGNISAAADGYNVAAPIWKKFMTEALKDKPNEDFAVPDGIKQVTISTASGLLPGPFTPADQQKTEVFASFSVPTEIDNSYVQEKVDIRNNKLTNDFCPPDFVDNRNFLNIHDIAPYPEWEKGAQEWIQNHIGNIMDKQNGTETAAGNVPVTIYGPPPTEISELCTQESFNSKPTIEIISPTQDQTISETTIDVKVNVSATNTIDKVEYYLDGQFKYFANTSPYDGRVRLPITITESNRHTITAKAIDKLGYASEATIEIITNASSPDQKITPASGTSTGHQPSDSNASPPPQEEPTI